MKDFNDSDEPDIKACFEKANQLLAEGKCEEALKYYDKAIEVDPENTRI